METTWQDQLRTVGLRVTRPRLSVLQVLAERPHADVDTIVTAARAVHPTLSPQAVYGVLEALVAGGLDRRPQPAPRPAPPPPAPPRRGRGGGGGPVAGGPARRVGPAGAPALFELRVGDNRHHLVCRS